MRFFQALFSGHQLVGRLSQALARHLVRDRIGGAILAPRALEDLGEARRDPLDISDDAPLGRVPAIFVPDADDAAGIDDVIG